MSRVHPLSSRVASHDKKRPPKLHQRRDLCAGHELDAALYEQGYQRGEPIFLQPPRRAQTQPKNGKPFVLDLSFVAPDDILSHFTRPPFSDVERGAIRKIELSRSDLEERLFTVWKQRFLTVSARNHVVLHGDLHALVKPGFERCREMKFIQKGWGAPYDVVNAQEGDGFRKYRGKRRTAVFLLRLAHAWPGGPGYVCAFGMDGCTTFVWNYRLARDFKHLLDRPRFVVAELELGRMPEHTTDLRWCMSWKIEPVLVHELDG